ncbi:MAG: hypothetical protein ACK4XJ_05500 [Fimbriimonadaceae bacterium]
MGILYGLASSLAVVIPTTPAWRRGVIGGLTTALVALLIGSAHAARFSAWEGWVMRMGVGCGIALIAGFVGALVGAKAEAATHACSRRSMSNPP